MKRLPAVAALLFSCGQLIGQNSSGNQDVIPPAVNLVVEGIPAIPRSLAEDVGRYEHVRSARLESWHPIRREMLISTRFADVPQVHLVKMPGGDRSQLTFSPDPVLGAYFSPKGDYFVFLKDAGGDEDFQFYRYDFTDGAITLLTDGKSRHGDGRFARQDDLFAFTSTFKNSEDTEIWIMDPTAPKSARRFLQLKGGGWYILDWSPDNKEILLQEYISANRSSIWIADVKSGEQKLLTPEHGEEAAYENAVFSRDGRGVYATTDRGSEFQRLAYLDLKTLKWTSLTTAIPWDVEQLTLSEDGRTLAFAADVDGISRLYLFHTATRTCHSVRGLPAGLIYGLNFHKNNRDLGIVINNAHSPSDVYSLNIRTSKLERWTFSETGGLNISRFVEPKLIRWPSFDGRIISGLLYRPDVKKFPGKRPVIVNIHGGPEGQARPGFMEKLNYLLNTLGIAILFPNIRGSRGYGKSFLKLDDGLKRDNALRDIGALFDWIGQNPDLDAGKIMIIGVSYGGYMAWSAATAYSDRICCSLAVAGPTSLITLLEHTEPYLRDLRRLEFGDERDPAVREFLEKTAPLNNSEKIHKPVFAVVGQNDPRVPWIESRQMVDKLKNNKIPVWFLMATDEGHGFSRKKNQNYQFYALVMFVRQFLLADPMLTAIK